MNLLTHSGLQSEMFDVLKGLASVLTVYNTISHTTQASTEDSLDNIYIYIN